jgi:hypothetical protein
VAKLNRIIRGWRNYRLQEKDFLKMG